VAHPHPHCPDEGDTEIVLQTRDIWSDIKEPDNVTTHEGQRNFVGSVICHSFSGAEDKAIIHP